MRLADISILAFVLLCQGNAVLEGIVPPRLPTDETAVSTDAPEFEQCLAAMLQQFDLDQANVEVRSFTRSGKWGHVLRAVVREEGGERHFVCWLSREDLQLRTYTGFYQ